MVSSAISPDPEVAAEAGDAGQPGLRLDEPVIVLTSARSGSTLLRFILDSHPALACPPETNIVELSARMGIVSRLLGGPDGNAQAGLSDLAAAPIRSWVTTVFARYLKEAGKVRWCDKSLASAPSAGRLLELFPKAKFVCLYRNCMDVIDSVHEACPWGLVGYGLEPFVAPHSGNTVAAVADYWVSQTRMIAQFERAYPQACLRVRYEDLTADPETEAERIFTFLGEEAVPAITSACFEAPRDRFGPSDHKIWETASVHGDSVGRGVRVPVGAIPPPVIFLINNLHALLGYRPVDKQWNAAPAAQMLEDESQMAGQGASLQDGAQDSAAAALDEVEALLVSCLERQPSPAAAPAQTAHPAIASPFCIAAAFRPAGGQAAVTRYWQVDVATASASRVSGPVTAASDGDQGWVVAGDAAAWIAVLTRQRSLASALRHWDLRIRGLSPAAEAAAAGEHMPAVLRNDPRIAILTRLIAPLPAGRVVAAAGPRS